ncbi:MAG: glycosyltransferase family 2 protein [Algoriphagus sp.]|nr:glycosyltransferase family 2 protein [Algoriphagus sp.]
MIFVSAVVPVYNSKSTLERAVNSLLIQKEINEIFLVDDGSEDGSYELCKNLESIHTNIKVLHHPNRINKGAPATRNLGLFEAKNKWIQFLDADDECLEGKISKQLGMVEEDTPIVVSQYFYKKVGIRSKISVMKDPWSGLISTRLGTTSANLWNGEIMKKAGGWNENHINVQEYFMMFEMLKIHDRVVFLSEPLTKIYYRQDSITNSGKMEFEKRENYFFFRNQIRDYLIKNKKFNQTRFHYYTICTGRMLNYHSTSIKIEFNKTYFKLYNEIRLLANMIRNLSFTFFIHPGLEFESLIL